MKLNYTKTEVNKLKEEIYFTEQELEILKYWILDYSIVQISETMKLSTSTVSRRKKSILDKINRMKSQ